MKITQTTVTQSIDLPDKQPWDQMEGESSTWYERFCMFRDTPPNDRSVNYVYKTYSKVVRFNREKIPLHIPKKQSSPNSPAPPNWYTAAKKFKWEERSNAYQVHLEGLKRKTKELEIQKIAQEELQQELRIRKQGAKILMNVGVVSAQRIAKRLQDDPEYHLKPTETAQFIRVAGEIQDRVNDVHGVARAGKEHPSMPFLDQNTFANMLQGIPDGRPVIEAETATLTQDQEMDAETKSASPA